MLRMHTKVLQLPSYQMYVYIEFIKAFQRKFSHIRPNKGLHMQIGKQSITWGALSSLEKH